VATDSEGADQADGLFVVSVESGEKRPLTHPQLPFISDTSPAISPDGGWLVFRRDVSPFNGELYRLPLEKGLRTIGEPTRLTPRALDAVNRYGYPKVLKFFFPPKALFGSSTCRERARPSACHSSARTG
jgi:hypothetical protein